MPIFVAKSTGTFLLDYCKIFFFFFLTPPVFWAFFLNAVNSSFVLTMPAARAVLFTVRPG